MAIRSSDTSSSELLRDSRYHRSAVASDPETHEMAEPLRPLEGELKVKRDVREEKEGIRMERLARLNRFDYLLDTVLGRVEFDVYGACDRNREDPRYRAVLPKGMAPIIALRGADEAIAVRAMLKVLGTHFPEIAKRHKKDLESLSESCEQAEKEWKQAEVDAAQALGAELVARRELVRQLQKNEGALMSLFPGDKRRVRSYFRQVKKGGKGGKGGDNGGSGGEGGGEG